MPVLTVEPLASVDESSAVASGRRKPVVLSFTRKPVPAPVAEASPRISERIAMVVVPLAPVPWLPNTLKVVTVRLATLAPAAEPRDAPRINPEDPALALAREEAVSRVAPPAPPFRVMSPAPTWAVKVPIVSLAADAPLPP